MARLNMQHLSKQHHQFRKQVQVVLSCTSLCHLDLSSSIAVEHGPCLLSSEQKGSGFRNQMPEETISPYLLLGTQDQRLDSEQDQLPCGPTGASSGNCQETETCLVRACHRTASPKPSFRAPWRVGDAVVSTGNAGWTASKLSLIHISEPTRPN